MNLMGKSRPNFEEALRESPNGSNQSPDVTSKAEPCSEDVGCSLSIDAQASEVTSKAIPATDNGSDGSLEDEGNDSKDNFKNVKEGDVNEGLKKLSEKLSAALVNVSAKEDLVKQHAKVAEEAIAGWEKAENEAAVWKKQLESAAFKNSVLEDRVIHLDGALKECVRQLRQTREEQEQNIHDAVVEKTHDLESAKLKLEKQLLELQSKLDTSNARSPVTVYHDLYQKVEHLEKENLNLKHDLTAQLEELKIRTIERDLSTKAAETASKQHLESIKKMAKLEAECRRLKSMSRRTSSINDHKSSASASICVESLSDSQSDSGERLNAVEIVDFHKMNGLESNKCETSCSDSWASALIAELDQFKNEKCRQPSSGSINIDLMDDFLEMERLASLSETKNESSCLEPVAANQCIYEEGSPRTELENMNQQMSELIGRLEKAEAEKAELEIALMKSEDCIEVAQLQLRQAEMKLDEMQRVLEVAYKSKEMIENQLVRMEEEAQTIFAKVDSLEAEVDRERATSVEIAIMCKELEEELERKKQGENLRCAVSSYGEKKMKKEDLALAAGKLAECQKTIASLGNQLKSLATLEDFLIDTASIPEFSASPSLIARASGDTWKLHSIDTFSPKRGSSSSKQAEGSHSPSLNKNEGSPPSSSLSSSARLPNVSSERSRNGFAKFFSRTKSGIRLEI
ncbi:filament-like plant protein isoform X2 [Prosopis cineraria]|uniref:filament-like plant protein isoform X2 n=1 Tax=Prosopis cineraria TaxID=364024 RepID=UPI00241060E8|nr:filament-like plant protein isoform X2 [Prosopis cineraria]